MSKILRYLQPGDKNYATPDEEYAKNITLDERLAKGYALTPEQLATLTPTQLEHRFDPMAQGIPGGVIVDKNGYQATGFGSWNPLYKDQHVAMGEHPNAVYAGNGIVSLGGKLLLAGIGAGLGAYALGGLSGMGAAAPAAATATATGGTGLGGLGLGGLQSGLFPLTTMAPSAIEASILPLTTAGAGGAYGGLAAGALGGAGDLLTFDNAKKVYDIAGKARNVVSALGGSGGSEGSGGALSGAGQKPVNQWARIFDMAALFPHTGTVEQPSYLEADMIQNRAAPSQSEMWRGLPQGMKDGGEVKQSVEMIAGPENRMYAKHAKRGFRVEGIGTGQSDEIPTMLARGEYVLDSDVVAALGDGSNDAGAEVLDKMREAIRKHKRSAHIGKIPPPAKSPLEYINEYSKLKNDT